MAIGIGSNHIYESENNKIIDNKISQIEVNAKEPTPLNEKNVPVYEKNLSDVSIRDSNSKNSNFGYDYANPSLGVLLSLFSHIKAYHGYIKTTISIPRQKINSYIKNIYSGDNIKLNVSYSQKKGSCTATMTHINYQGSYYIDTAEIYNIQEDIPEETIIEAESIPTIGTTIVKNYQFPSINGGAVATSELHIEDLTNLRAIQPNTSYQSFRLQNITILAETKLYKFKGRYEGDTSQPATVPLEGEYIHNKATRIEIVINGDKIGFNLEDNTVYIPEETTDKTKIISVEGNEILQTTNYYKNESGVQEPYVERMFNKTLDLYKNGKETATLLCDLEKYPVSAGVRYIEYDYGNTGWIIKFGLQTDPRYSNSERKKIDFVVNKKNYTVIVKANETVSSPIEIPYTEFQYMGINGYKQPILGQNVVVKQVYYANTIFQPYDTVIPMVYGADGKDKPMSKYKDGNPKEFQVLSVEPFSRGGAWQRIIIQEK